MLGLAGGMALGAAQWLPGWRLRRPVAAGRDLLRLLHQRLAARPPPDPGGVPVRPRHQPGPARPTTSGLQLPGGHQLRRASWPSSPPASCSCAGGAAGPSPGTGGSGTWCWRRSALRGRQPDPLRPGSSTWSRGSTASGCSTATCCWSTSALAVLLAWWSHLLLTERDAAGPRPRTIRSQWRPGQPGRAHRDLDPLRPQRPALPGLLGGRPAPRPRSSRRRSPWTGPPGCKRAPLVTAGTIIAGVATWIVLSEARFSAPTLRRLLAGVLTVDLLLFNLLRHPAARRRSRGPGAQPGLGRPCRRRRRRPLHRLRPRPLLR